jgi:hypothetical protein
LACEEKYERGEPLDALIRFACNSLAVTNREASIISSQSKFLYSTKLLAAFSVVLTASTV